MRPPICALCSREFDPAVDGDLVSFAEDPLASEPEPGGVGHPDHREWFCARHRSRALALAERGLRRDEALAQLRAASWWARGIAWVRALRARGGRAD